MLAVTYFLIKILDRELLVGDVKRELDMLSITHLGIQIYILVLRFDKQNLCI